MKRIVFAALAVIGVLVGASSADAEWFPKVNKNGTVTSWYDPIQEFPKEPPYPSNWLIIYDSNKCVWEAFDLNQK
jgi:hypothetical protein